MDISNIEEEKIMDIKLKSVEVKREYSMNNILKVKFSSLFMVKMDVGKQRF